MMRQQQVGLGMGNNPGGGLAEGTVYTEWEGWPAAQWTSKVIWQAGNPEDMENRLKGKLAGRQSNW